MMWNYSAAATRFVLLCGVVVAVALIQPTTPNSTSLSPPQCTGPMEDEKSRLGSTPPSCHNKCNACHPCRAVQVPTMPLQPRPRPRPRPRPLSSYLDTSANTNYKPLGWKCRCAGHLFNP